MCLDQIDVEAVPARIQHRPGSIEGVAADRVKHHLDVLIVALEASRRVVDDFLGAKAVSRIPWSARKS